MSGEECVTLYKQKFGLNPEWLIRCPGRVNLIGEHIDYSNYPVLPMAIEDSTWVAAGIATANNNQTKEIRLENANSRYNPFTLEIGNSFSNSSANGKSPQWYHYFFAGWRGALERLYGNENLEQAKGMFILIGSKIPPSAGLSSSSALVCAAALATLCVQTGQAFGNISKKDLAEFATKAERFVGMEGGGMDQACECLAERGSALLIDFAPLRFRPVTLPSNALFAVIHSGKECNKGADSQYNQRVVECRLAAQMIAKKAGLDLSEEFREKFRSIFSIRTLRDIAELVDRVERPGEMLELVQHLKSKNPEGIFTRKEICEFLGCSDEDLAKYSLNSNTQDMQIFSLGKRAEHVYSEAARVLEFERICKSQDKDALEKLAELMNASHKSCANLFECSCPELDATVQKCLNSGCLAARLTGAGWGGCVVALVDKANKKAVEESGLNVIFWSEPCEGIEAFSFEEFTKK